MPVRQGRAPAIRDYWSQAQHDTVLAQPALAYGGVQERHPDQASHGFPRLIDDPSPAIVPARGRAFASLSGGCAMDSGPGSRFGHGRASWGNPHKRLLRPRNAWLEPGLGEAPAVVR
ncbi:hypothetical protein ACPA9J_18815 [Pseudomonas aeruginosa]